ncbi:MAG: class IV adenylate cyclase [Nitrospirae bacterium]|nr:MAG: class IV adenylate cyclase [Nitrospirota bacterium]
MSNGSKIEHEVKILEIDRDKIIERLEEIGAERIFEGLVVDEYFDYPDRRLRKGGHLLRIREKGDDIIVTIKGPSLGGAVKSREEREFSLSSAGGMKELLHLLDLECWLKLTKKRTVYKKGDVRFAIDAYLNEFGFIPEFLEIEAVEVEDIYRYASLLGYEKHSCLPWSFEELRRFYEGRGAE